MRDARGGVLAAEVGVGAEGVGGGGLGRFAAGLGEDDGGEPRVEDGVEVLGDGVEGSQVVDGEVGGEREDEFRVEEDGVEDGEGAGVGARVDVGWWGKDGEGSLTFQLVH